MPAHPLWIPPADQLEDVVLISDSWRSPSPALTPFATDGLSTCCINSNKIGSKKAPMSYPFCMVKLPLTISKHSFFLYKRQKRKVEPLTCTPDILIRIDNTTKTHRASPMRSTGHTVHSPRCSSIRSSMPVLYSEGPVYVLHVFHQGAR